MIELISSFLFCLVGELDPLFCSASFFGGENFLLDFLGLLLRFFLAYSKGLTTGVVETPYSSMIKSLDAGFFYTYPSSPDEGFVDLFPSSNELSLTLSIKESSSDSVTSLSSSSLLKTLFYYYPFCFFNVFVFFYL